MRLYENQCRSWSDGFLRSHLIWIYNVFKRINPGSAGHGLRWWCSSKIIMTMSHYWCYFLYIESQFFWKQRPVIIFMSYDDLTDGVLIIILWNSLALIWQDVNTSIYWTIFKITVESFRKPYRMENGIILELRILRGTYTEWPLVSYQIS